MSHVGCGPPSRVRLRPSARPQEPSAATCRCPFQALSWLPRTCLLASRRCCSHQRSAHTSTLNLGAERLQRGRAEQRACPESQGWFSSFDTAASKTSDLRCRAYEPSQEVRAALPGAAVRLQDTQRWALCPLLAPWLRCLAPVSALRTASLRELFQRGLGLLRRPDASSALTFQPAYRSRTAGSQVRRC